MLYGNISVNDLNFRMPQGCSYSRFELLPQTAKACWIGYPLNGVGMTTKLFINRDDRRKAEFRVSSCFPTYQFGN